MIRKNNYDKLIKEFSEVGSWAIWAHETDSPRSNTGNMSWVNDPQLLKKINTGFVFVGLNWSGSPEDLKKPHKGIPWKTFHSDHPHQNDYKLRYALRDTRYWGSYITDIIKYHCQTDSGEVTKYLKSHPEELKKNIELFEKEIALLGEKPVLVALGGKTYDILKENLGSKYKIAKIKHCSFTIGKENYREEVLDILKKY